MENTISHILRVGSEVRLWNKHDSQRMNPTAYRVVRVFADESLLVESRYGYVQVAGPADVAKVITTEGGEG